MTLLTMILLTLAILTWLYLVRVEEDGQPRHSGLGLAWVSKGAAESAMSVGSQARTAAPHWALGGSVARLECVA